MEVGDNLLAKTEVVEGNSGVTPTGSRGRSLLHSVAWNAAGDWVSQIFSWASFLIVIRVLSPADFGIVAMAATLSPFLQCLSGSGIPRAIVTLRNLTDDQLAQLNTVALLLGVATFGASALLAAPVAWFYRTPRLSAIVIVGAVGLIANGAQAVSNGLLTKEMRFRVLSIFGAASTILAAVLTLAFALMGFGYWALVLGSLLGGFARAGLVMTTRRQRYAMPRIDSVREPLKFGWHVVVSLIALTSYQNLDNLVAGRVLGKTAVGLYAMAWSLAYVPLDKVTSLVTTVLPSYVSAVQTELGTVRRYIRVLTENLALIMFPACVGLGLIARELVPIVLGHKWEGMIGPLQVLSIYTAFRSVAALMPRVLTALGNPRFVMWNDIATIVVLGISFYVGSRWGITGIAWGWVAGYPIVIIPLYRKTLATIKMSAVEYFRCLRPAIEGTIVMVLAVLEVKHLLAASGSLLLQLGVEVVTGVLFYSATVFLRHREQTMEAWRLIRTTMGR